MVLDGLDATIASAIERLAARLRRRSRRAPDRRHGRGRGSLRASSSKHDLGKAAADGMFAADIDIERLARHIFIHPDRPPRTVGGRCRSTGTSTATRRGSASRSPWRRCWSSRYASEAMQRSGLVADALTRRRSYASCRPMHRRHAPLAEIESSGLQSPWEHPGRADAIHDVLAADDRFAMLAPDDWGTDADRRGARPWPRRVPRAGVGRLPGPPPRHARRGARRVRRPWPARRHRPACVTNCRSSAELGRWCFETTTPLTEGTYEAARGAVDIALDARRNWSSTGRGHAYGLCRPPGHHAPTGVVRRLLLLQQRRRRRAPRRVDHRDRGHRARRRLSPRQRHAADLLRPRRRPVRVAARRPGAGLPVPHRIRRRVRAPGAGEGPT